MCNKDLASKTQENWISAVDTGLFVFDILLCDKVVSEKLFIVKYCLDRYKTQELLL